MDEFNVGDVVIVKGTSVRMTISKMSNVYDIVDCIWFDSGDGFHRATFPKEILRKLSG